MPPLSQQEREKNLAEMQQQEALDVNLPAESDSDTGDDGQTEESENSGSRISLEAQKAQELELLALRENLKARNEQAAEMLAAQKKAKEAFDRIQKLKEEVLSLDKDFKGYQQQTQGIQREMEQQQPLDLSGIHQQISGQPGIFPGVTNQQQLGVPGVFLGAIISPGHLQQQNPGNPVSVSGPTVQAQYGTPAGLPVTTMQQQPTSTVPGVPAGTPVMTAQQQQQLGNMNLAPSLIPGGTGARQKQTPQVAAAPAPVIGQFPGSISSATHPYQAAVDPTLTAYGQAYANLARAPGTQAAQAFATPPAQQVPCAAAFGTPPTQPVPGVSPQVWMQQNPLLGAAAGLGSTTANRSASEKDKKEGKCLPEQYIEKSAINDPDVKAPSYYDFVHGIFRMLNEKVNEKNEPINDLLVYYEQITNYATQHRWSAVFSLHRSMCNEVELGMRNWASEIKYRNASKHLNVASDLSELKRNQSAGAGGGAPPRKKSSAKKRIAPEQRLKDLEM